MKKTLFATAAILAVAITGVALAQPGPGGRDRGDGPGRGTMAIVLLGAADYNGDNTVTRAEVERLQAEEFAFRDRNSDGFLDRDDASPTRQRVAEMAGEEAGGRRGQRGMARLDSDGDGRISLSEFTGRESRLFDRLDTNGDDAVSPEELDAAVAHRQARREARRGMRLWWRD